MPAGFYEVVLKQEGYNDVFERVLVRAGETVVISEKLSFKKGVCSISSMPSGAKVYLDGKYKGKTPVVFTAEEAVHSLKIKKTGYNTFSKEVNVSYDEPLLIKEELHLSIFVYLAAVLVLLTGAFFVKNSRIPEINIPLGSGILAKYEAKFRKTKKTGIQKKESFPSTDSILTKYEAKFRKIKKLGIKKKENRETETEISQESTETKTTEIETAAEIEVNLKSGKESTETKTTEIETNVETEVNLKSGKESAEKKTTEMEANVETKASTGNLIELNKMPEPEFKYTVKKREKD